MHVLDINEGHRIDRCEMSVFDLERPLPLVIQPRDGERIDLLEVALQKETLDALLGHYGAILFRGFDEASKEVFNDFISHVSSDALFYSERSSPRHAVYKNIYTSTDHPAEKEIVQHSEQSYNKSFPRRIFFYCEKPSEVGGNTPIADARKIYQRIPKEIVESFDKRQYRYSRCFWQVMGTTWQTTFQTSEKSKVEEYCRSNDIHFEWFPDDVLKTYQMRRTTAYHPVTGEPCWFNHCAFFNLLSLDEETQEILSCSFEPHELPNQTFYGDGAIIEDAVVRALQDAYKAETVEFDWKTGDVIMIDNMLVTHGRRTYKGERSLLCGMSDITHWEGVQNKPSA